jgi:large subunit ribosomal protein L22
MSEKQSTKAIAKYIRISPYKVRRVLDQIRGRSYQEALMMLEFMPYRSCAPIWQVLHSAAANAQNNLGLEKKNLIVETAYANEGPKLKRIRPRAQGRAYKILKPTCHITITVKSIV